MFNLTLLTHTLRLQPHLLTLPLNEAVKGELEGLFLDKVIANVGLCISVYDIKSIKDGFIFPNKGAPTYTYHLDFLMTYTPELLMPEPSVAEPSEVKNQVIWKWTFNDESYYIDGVDEIRFRVQNVKFPEIPKEQTDMKAFAPMEIIGSLVSDGGLGPVVGIV